MLAPEYDLCQRFGKLRLADAGRSEKQEGTNRTHRIFQAGTVPAHGLRDRLHSLLLSDNPPVQLCVQTQQPFSLLLCQALHWNLGPCGNDLLNILTRHFRFLPVLLLADALFLPLQLLIQCRLLQIQLLCRSKIARTDRILPLICQAFALLLQLPRLLSGPEISELPARGRLIHQVNRLIRQEPVIDIACRQLHSCLQRFVRDRHLVMLFIGRTQPPQNFRGFPLRRLFDLDRLESPLQGSILLNIFPVFFLCRRTDQLQLSARQGGLQNIRRIQRTLGAACPDNRVQLIHEQQNIAAVNDLRNDPLDPLLKFAPVLGASHHSCHIQRHHALSAHRLRHILLLDPLCESFYDGSLAHARLTDQAGVILRTTAENLDQPLDLRFSSDRHIQTVIGCQPGQIPAILIQHWRRAHAVTVGCLLCLPDQLLILFVLHADHPGDIGVQPRNRNSQRMQKPRSDAFYIAQNREQNMLRPDRIALQEMSDLLAVLQNTLRTRRPPLLRLVFHAFRSYQPVDQLHQLLFLHFARAQDDAGRALLLLYKPDKQMLRSGIAVSTHFCSPLRQMKHLHRASRILNLHPDILLLT